MTEMRLQLTRAVDPVLLCLVAAETAILWLVASLLLTAEPGEGQSVPPLAVFAVMVVAAVLPRALDAYDLWDPGFTVVMAAGMAATTLLLIKTSSFPSASWLDPGWLRETAEALTLRSSTAEIPVWGLVAVSVYSWARGRRRAEPTLDASYTGLRIGSVAMVLAAVADGVTPSPVTDTDVAVSVLTFIAGSLTAISLARMAGEREDRYRALRAPAVLGGVVAPIVLVTLAGLAIGGVANRDLLDAVIWALAPLIWALTVLLRVLILVVAVIAFIIVSPILWLLSGTDFAPIRSTPQGSQDGLRERVREEVERTTDVPDPIRYLVVSAILITLIVLLGRFALRRRQRLGPAADEERVSVLNGADLLAAMGNRLKRALGLLRPDADPLADLRADRRWAHTVAVREAYTALMRLGVERGVRRPPGRTAREHGGHLAAELPGGDALAPEVARLTGLYDAARYGAAPATEAEAAAAQTAWREIERAVRQS